MHWSTDLSLGNKAWYHSLGAGLEVIFTPRIWRYLEESPYVEIT